MRNGEIMEEQTYKEKIDDKVNEDGIIKNIMLEHPDLFEMMDFNEYDIKGKLEKNAWWYQQFRLLTIQEKRKLNRIVTLKDEYIGELYHQLRFENDIQLGKIETEKYFIPKDKKAIHFMTLVMKQSITTE